MSRYRCILLGHEEKTIQATLDKIPVDHRLTGIALVGGVNVIAIVDTVIDCRPMALLSDKDIKTLQSFDSGWRPISNPTQVTSITGPCKSRAAKAKLP